MRTNQTLEEARKYLCYAADMLHAVASAYSTDSQDGEILKKYAADLFDYSNGLEKLKLNITSKEQAKKKLEVVAELEDGYAARKQMTAKARENLRIVRARLKQIEAAGTQAEIEEAKRRVDYYAKQHAVASYNESIAKREFEQGA